MWIYIFGSSLLLLLGTSIEGTKTYDKVKHNEKAFSGNVTGTHQTQVVSHLSWTAEDRQSPLCKTNGLINNSSPSCNSYHLFSPKEDDNPYTQAHVSDVRYYITKVDERSGVYTFDLNCGTNHNDLVDCGTPANRSHAKLIRVVTTTFNITLTYTCDSGCSSTDWDNTITCQENGSGSETSLDWRVSCGDNWNNADPGHATATTLNTTVTFTCAQGYRNHGDNDTIVCQENGQWSPTSLDCQAIKNAITTKTLSAGPSTLTCTNRFSKRSGRKVSASCKKDEVLTDCSSKIESGGKNNGVKIVVTKNTLTCLLDSTGLKSDIPWRMRAVARCCKLEGIRCEYLTDGPTGKKKGERIKSVCAKPFKVMGCSAFMVDGWLDGVKIVSEYCSAFVGLYSHTGVSTYSSCCRAPGLSCKIHKGSSRIRNRLMTKRCPKGSVLTGCSGYEHFARQRGSFIKDVRGTPTCHVEGKNKNTLVYYVCCRSRST